MAFDPYYVWLGIPPNEQPPNHYRLLGVNLYEDNLDAICHAGDRQMAHVRTFQTGPHAGVSQQLLREIALARICLLDPEKKSAYDAELRAKIARQMRETMVLDVEKPAQAQPLPSAKPLVPVVVQVKPHAAAPPVVARSDDRQKPAPLPRRARNPLVETAKIIGGGLAGLALGVLLLRFALQIDVTGLLPITPRSESRQVAERDAKDTKQQADPVDRTEPNSHGPAAAAANTDIVSVADVGSDGQADPDPDHVVGFEPADVDPLEAKGNTGKGKKNRRGKAKDSPPAAPVAATARAAITAARMTPRPLVDDPRVPAELRGATLFDLADKPSNPRIDLGLLEFKVEASGPIYLLADWNYQGNRTGGWAEQAVSKEELIQLGWEHVGRCPWLGSEEKPIELFRKLCKEGESYSIRVNKYWPPLPIVPAASEQPQESPSPPSAQLAAPAASVLQAARLPVPTAAERAGVEQQLETVYGLAMLNDDADRLRVAGELVSLAKTSPKPAERFVMLRRAVDLAQEGRDAKLALSAVDALAREFEAVDPVEKDQLAFEAELIDKLALGLRRTSEVEGLVKGAHDSIRFALAEGRYDLAGQMADAVQRACSRPVGRSFLKYVALGQRKVKQQHEAWRDYEAALKRLAASPGDPAAHLIAGKWLAQERCDWRPAIAHFAEADGAVGRAAALDKAGAADAEGLLAVAEAWDEAAAAEPREPLWRLRAALLYARADRARLTGISVAKVERRLDELLKDEAVVALLETMKTTPGVARISDKLPPIVRRHCVLLLTFEPDDILPSADKPTLRDLSGHLNHATIDGPVAAPGKASQAFRFDGRDDFLECEDAPSLNMTDALSVCAWVRQESSVQPGDADDIVSKDEWGNGRGAGFVLRFHNRAPDFNFGNGPDWFWVRSPSAPAPGTWVHLAAVYDGRHQALLVNGVEVASRPTPKRIDPSNSKLRIGRGAFAQDRRWHGLIDEVAVFDAPLTAADVRTIYELGKSGQPLSN